MTTPRGLRLHHGSFADSADRQAYQALMHDVLGLPPGTAADDSWRPISLFDRDGTCVANVDAGLLSLVVDRVTLRCAGIRSVAVDPNWRGRGLFRALMSEALSWCDMQGMGLALLFTAEPALYERFGFVPVMQHAFLGTAPAPRPAVGQLEVMQPTDPRISSLLAERTPVSMQATLLVGPALFMANLAGDDAPTLAYSRALDVAIAFEDGDTLVVADIVGKTMPELATLLGALGKAPRQVKTLFPPDRLGWQGEPVLEETGLMVLGPLPAALTRPFMFPPTTEF